jgi:SnoaL-like domain
VDDGLKLLLDERAVRQVMLRYAEGVDGRDWVKVRGCFSLDAEIVGIGFSGPRDEYLARLSPGVESYAVTMHTIGNQLIEIDGDTAQTETDLVARHFADAEGREEKLTLGVRYSDRLRRDGKAWVITRRDVRRLWSRP